jgi:uncharacterized SAM-binding protein YcdF (DUF218 family)
MSIRARPARILASAVLALLLLPVLAWGAGLVWYIQIVDALPMPVPVADGIVALTGGAERVETALQLLAGGRAPRLLLSGIGGGAELTELDNRAGVDATSMAAKITLGRDAHTTRGNAIETAAWARREGLHSLIVVTAAYHMPRALLELQRAFPEGQLFALPVHPHGFIGWRRLQIVAVEFTKFLAAEIGLSAIAPERSADRHGSRPGLISSQNRYWVYKPA